MHATIASTGGEPVEVLLGLMGPRSLTLARSFAEAGYTPILAFTSEQLRASAATADVILADTAVDPGAVALRSAGSNTTVRLFVGEPDEAPWAEVHSFVAPDTTDDDIVAHTRALVALRGRAAVPDDLIWGPLQLDAARREGAWHGDAIDLTATQFDILEVLVRAGARSSRRKRSSARCGPAPSPTTGRGCSLTYGASDACSKTSRRIRSSFSRRVESASGSRSRTRAACRSCVWPIPRSGSFGRSRWAPDVGPTATQRFASGSRSSKGLIGGLMHTRTSTTRRRVITPLSRELASERRVARAGSPTYAPLVARPDRLPQFALVENYFSAVGGTARLRSRYDDVLKAVDSGDASDADAWQRWARRIGVSSPDLAHFVEHWLGLDAGERSRSENAYFPELHPKATRDSILGGFMDAVRSARMFDLPLSVVLVPVGLCQTVRVHHVVTGPAVVIMLYAPLPDEIVRAK